MTIDLAAYDTDKPSSYLANYSREFGHLFDEPIRLLELGIYRGGSMLLWRDLLPKAEIAGLDRNEIRGLDDPRLHIYQGFQQDPAILDRIAAEVAPDGFDVILDDASHLGRYTAQSFWHLFPRHLKGGGVYIIDDWGTGYFPEWGDGHEYSGTRAALGDFRDDSPTKSLTSALTRLRIRARSAARPMASRLSPQRRDALEQLYMRIEGLFSERRFPSHDYGMVGFIKQLVDACAIADIDRGGAAFDNQIESLHIYGSQVFVHKRGCPDCHGTLAAASGWFDSQK